MGSPFSLKVAVIANIKAVEHSSICSRKFEMIVILPLNHVRLQSGQYIRAPGTKGCHQAFVHGVFVEIELKGHAGRRAAEFSFSNRSASASSAAKAASI